MLKFEFFFISIDVETINFFIKLSDVITSNRK